MDLTGSMQPYLDVARIKMIEIIDNIQKNCPGAGINIGFSSGRNAGNVIPAEEILEYKSIGYAFDYATCAMYLGQSPKEAVETTCKLCCYVSEPIESYTIKL